MSPLHPSRRRSPAHRIFLLQLLVALATGLGAGAVSAQRVEAPAVAQDGPKDFSPSERALFMTNHFMGQKPPATLRYQYTKSGDMEAGFQDAVTVKLSAGRQGRCCVAETEFLSAANKLNLPVEEAVEGNPVVLHFLERDVREMSRLTKGQSAYFRKRIRMAIYQGAQIEQTQAEYQGRSVPVQVIRITPFKDDPLRVRFEKLADKQYTFTLSSHVPGGVLAMSSRVEGAAGAKGPWWQEDLRLGAAK